MVVDYVVIAVAPREIPNVSAITQRKAVLCIMLDMRRDWFRKQHDMIWDSSAGSFSYVVLSTSLWQVIAMNIAAG